MKKETIIVIIIVILIILANIITQNYTKETVKEMNEKLDEIKVKIVEEGKEDINKDNIKDKLKDLTEDWEKHHDKLAYYIEHDELEKVETGIVVLNSDVENNDIDQAMAKISESKFLLEHIQDKYAFSLENIF